MKTYKWLLFGAVCSLLGSLPKPALAQGFCDGANAQQMPVEIPSSEDGIRRFRTGCARGGQIEMIINRINASISDPADHVSMAHFIDSNIRDIGFVCRKGHGQRHTMQHNRRFGWTLEQYSDRQCQDGEASVYLIPNTTVRIPATGIKTPTQMVQEIAERLRANTDVTLEELAAVHAEVAVQDQRTDASPVERAARLALGSELANAVHRIAYRQSLVSSVPETEAATPATTRSSRSSADQLLIVSYEEGNKLRLLAIVVLATLVVLLLCLVILLSRSKQGLSARCTDLGRENERLKANRQRQEAFILSEAVSKQLEPYKTKLTLVSAELYDDKYSGDERFKILVECTLREFHEAEKYHKNFEDEGRSHQETRQQLEKANQQIATLKREAEEQTRRIRTESPKSVPPASLPPPSSYENRIQTLEQDLEDERKGRHASVAQLEAQVGEFVLALQAVYGALVRVSIDTNRHLGGGELDEAMIRYDPEQDLQSRLDYFLGAVSNAIANSPTVETLRQMQDLCLEIEELKTEIGQHKQIQEELVAKHAETDFALDYFNKHIEAEGMVLIDLIGEFEMLASEAEDGTRPRVRALKQRFEAFFEGFSNLPHAAQKAYESMGAQISERSSIPRLINPKTQIG